MAKNSTMLTCAFLVALTLSYGVWFTEESQLGANIEPKAPYESVGGGGRHEVTSEKAFRPTSPGHSPGAGHSLPPPMDRKV
ncbi:hypothetical protein Acr_01g0012430 [Actinidia rufa]|uniref:Uncharacterized protein n=1 Tax=Actinidia rufa TaxID=165716 RepID=A0A7J0E4L3_9ERIC|nr:hypothetical protein Acr_01g0012430 [Actinidia rufa]